MKFCSKIKSLTPAGYPLEQEKFTFIFGNAISFLYSMGFFMKLRAGISSLYITKGSTKILADDAVMPSFIKILGNSLIPFIIMIFVMLIFIALHYHYHFEGSKSIYTMKRLPQKNELMKRCCYLPCVLASIILLAFVFLFAVFYLTYYLMTPDELIPLFI